MVFKINGGRLGDYAQNHEIKRYFGLRWEDKLPEKGMPDIKVAGYFDGQPMAITLVMLSKAEAKTMHPTSSRPRRIHAKCPGCLRLVCAGHTIQHKCKEVVS